MREITQTNRFQKELKRQIRRGSDKKKLVAAVRLLAETGELPRSYRPHLLSGSFAGIWDCHIEPDWLLLYEVNDTEVILFRTGSHSDLFE